MQDSALLEATWSERMTLEEEVENQQSWRDDETKCTFIILARDVEIVEEVEEYTRHNLVTAMVGDVNLFLSEEEDDEEVDPFAPPKEIDPDAPPLPRQAEVDIMIADQGHHRKGIGKEATSLMMLYGASKLGIRRFFCKINEDNLASRNLFSKKLNFTEKQYVAVFQQYELELRKETNDELIDCLENMVGKLRTFAFPLVGNTEAVKE